MILDVLPLLASIVGVALLVVLVAGIRAQLSDAIEFSHDGWSGDWPQGTKR